MGEESTWMTSWGKCEVRKVKGVNTFIWLIQVHVMIWSHQDSSLSYLISPQQAEMDDGTGMKYQHQIKFLITHTFSHWQFYIHLYCVILLFSCKYICSLGITRRWQADLLCRSARGLYHRIMPTFSAIKADRTQVSVIVLIICANCILLPYNVMIILLNPFLFYLSIYVCLSLFVCLFILVFLDAFCWETCRLICTNVRGCVFVTAFLSESSSLH